MENKKNSENKNQHHKKTKIILTILIIISISVPASLLYIYNTNYFKFSEDVIEHEDLFRKGYEGYNTFRIPALISLSNGVIIALAEARKDSASDYGNIDLVMRRSEDNGSTWGSLVVIRDEGSLAVQNPAPVYDKMTGILFLHYVVDRKDYFIINSSDLGKTWSEPRNISNIKKASMNFFGPAPGHGIQLRSGRLLVAGMNNKLDDNGNFLYWGSHLVYSDDHGKSWQLGADFGNSTNECLSTQLSNDSIYTILRPNRGNADNNFIKVSISNDGGITSTIPLNHPDLPTPIVQSSIITYHSDLDSTDSNTENHEFSEDVLLLSSPGDPNLRTRMTIRLSFNSGDSWNVSKRLYQGPSGYSDLSIMENSTILLLFERGQVDYREKITLIKFNLDSILNA